ncbi:carbamate kinase [Komagataeibacter intermedius]|uniref:Carbamate kinase n=2 Tax=Komagataeibacter intermedius TaxID=66229 RepID=A0A0N1FQJ3_9PROT|nr:carbamate kinase [Komagataeibacter intermedius]KPH87949.1 carbamate kinase [Komagataeibacter intermedius AF2]MCF3635917.1 carbamate kinase [Komagataeibacter intermedius]GAN86444.1 carbamate kinase [Komagataeibacter intermedius TF2]GBQ68283.1 carbamate kinase [Komagataeibacter intermedius NRIC 0521]
MKSVIALGGNALMQRGQPLSISVQRENARMAACALAGIARRHQLVLTHGNGPQVGLLAMQSQAFRQAPPYPFDIMGAATEGMIGYILEQELGNVLGRDVPVATLLTRVEVDPDDPEFTSPSKYIGPHFDEAQAQALIDQYGWTFKKDGPSWRRVIASPHPLRILWHRPIRWLLDNGAVIICGGGGGIPVISTPDGSLQGIDAVIDKDRVSSLLAVHLSADLFIIATDVPGIYENYGTPQQKLLTSLTAGELKQKEFSKGSMGPKVEAIINFVQKTGRPAAIGCLSEIEKIIARQAGTWIMPDAN